MEAGRLNHRITVQKKAKAIQHEGLYKFYIRHRRGITAEMRILWDDGSGESPRVFTLTGPPADWKGEKIGLTLIAKELV